MVTVAPFKTIDDTSSGLRFEYRSMGQKGVHVTWVENGLKKGEQTITGVTKSVICREMRNGKRPALLKGRVTLEYSNETRQIFTPVQQRKTPYPTQRDRLFSAIQKIYAQFKLPEKRNACLQYLLHYQHYNAEFTNSENDRLGYPRPLCAQQVKPGYLRSEHDRLIQLTIPWLKKNIPENTQSDLKDPKPFSKITLITLPLLFDFFRMYIPVVKHTVFKEQKISTDTKCLVLIPVSPEDLQKPGHQIIDQMIGRLTPVQQKNTYFLFGIKSPDIDCIFAWAGGWDKENKQLFRYFGLDWVFREKIFSHLIAAGIVPDRLAVNRFITQNLGKENFSNELVRCMNLPLVRIKQLPPSYNWIDQLEKIKSFEFKDDPGCALYREAILNWNELISRDCELLDTATPLLEVEVCPWIQNDGKIVDWAKGYQNLSEIVMFLIQAFPNKFKKHSFEDEILKDLPSDRIEKTAGLFAYGMTSLYYVMSEIRNTFKDSTPSVACITQSYFETLFLIENMKNHRSIRLINFESLGKINALPDVLITDIHPNNAARSKLFQNDVARWVVFKLKKNPDKRLYLILDITLNHLSDPIVKKTFEDLLPYIQSGRLHLFGIQSLAKLVQLGADNFSGGVAFHLGRNKTITFPGSIREKSAFFALLISCCDKLIPRYFELVRANTDQLYRILKKQLNEIKRTVRIDEKDDKPWFCAAGVTMNLDDQTVYVALNFEELLKECNITNDKKRCYLVKRLRKILIESASIRGLPLTERQSFGFALTSISDVKDSIRISVGVENKDYLQRYSELIYDGVHALSKYVARFGMNTNPDQFRAFFLRANRILQGNENLPALDIPLTEKSFSENGDATIDEKETVQLSYSAKELKLLVNRGKTEIGQEGIRVSAGYGNIPGSSWVFDWSSSVYCSLFFHICAFKKQSLWVFKNHEPCYFIGGFLNIGYLFQDDGEIEDKESGVKIVIRPKILLKYREREYESDKIFVDSAELGITSYPLDKVHETAKYELLEAFDLHHLEVKQGSNPETISLKIGRAKTKCDYSSKIINAWGKEKLSGVMGFVQQLAMDDLPLDSDHHWESAPSSLESLLHALARFGYTFPFPIAELRENLSLLTDKRCLEAILEGVANRLMDDSLSAEQKLTEENVKQVSALFSENVNFINEMLYHIELEKWIKAVDQKLLEISIIQAWDKEKLSGVIGFVNQLDMENLPRASDHHWESAPSSLEALLRALVRFGYTFPFFIAKSRESLSSLTDKRCLQAILKGVDNRLKDDNPSAEQKLTEESDAQISALFSENANSINKMHDYFGLEKWIKAVDQKLLESSDDGDRIKPFLDSLIPVMGRFFQKINKIRLDLKIAPGLKAMADRLNHAPLQEFVKSIENESIKRASEIRADSAEADASKSETPNNTSSESSSSDTVSSDTISASESLTVKEESSTSSAEARRISQKKTDKKNKELRTLIDYLELFVRYPFSDEHRQTLIANLKRDNNKLFVDWFDRSGFFFVPFQEDDIESKSIYWPETPIFLEENRELIKEFFYGLGCKELLIEHASEYPYAVTYWAKLLDDTDLQEKSLLLDDTDLQEKSLNNGSSLTSMGSRPIFFS